MTKQEWDVRVLKIRDGKPVPVDLLDYAAELHARSVRPIDAAPKLAWREHGLHH